VKRLLEIKNTKYPDFKIPICEEAERIDQLEKENLELKAKIQELTKQVEDLKKLKDVVATTDKSKTVKFDNEKNA
jgi:cell division protein FtsB